jgi:hypothetical protein
MNRDKFFLFNDIATTTIESFLMVRIDFGSKKSFRFSKREALSFDRKDLLLYGGDIIICKIVIALFSKEKRERERRRSRKG